MPITKDQITNTLIKDNSVKTNIQIVAITYLNISFEKLTKKLSLLNSLVNQKLFRYFRKYPDRRIAFFCNHEKVENNTHSHKGICLEIDNCQISIPTHFFSRNEQSH